MKSIPTEIKRREFISKLGLGAVSIVSSAGAAHAAGRRAICRL